MRRQTSKGYHYSIIGKSQLKYLNQVKNINDFQI